MKRIPTSVLSILVLSLLTMSTDAKAPEAYARPELLVEAPDLTKLRESSKRPVHVLDARTKDAYQAGHIPGAVWVDAAA